MIFMRFNPTPSEVERLRYANPCNLIFHCANKNPQKIIEMAIGNKKVAYINSIQVQVLYYQLSKWLILITEFKRKNKC